MAIKNIIFDLGGVLLNLDFEKTAGAFTALGVKDFHEYFTQYHADPLFKKLEVGAVADQGFYDAFRKTAVITAGNNEIDTAWNAMLLDFPVHRIEKLKELGSSYRLFLFSNTNAIHHEAFHHRFYEQFGFQLDSLFEKAYYSHLIGYRKPGLDAFNFVINDSKVAPAETLFIDDTRPNVDAALQVGLHAALVSPQKDLVKVLSEIL